MGVYRETQHRSFAGLDLPWADYEIHTKAVETGGFHTDHELAALTKRPLSTINGARNRLTLLGLIGITDQKRMGPYGKLNIVWEYRTSPVRVEAPSDQQDLFKQENAA